MNKRLLIVVSLLGVVVIALIGRLFYLNVFNRNFLIQQSQARILRKVIIPSYRGMITDRLGEPLAISAPVVSVWMNPRTFNNSVDQIKQLAQYLSLSPRYITHLLKTQNRREFIYLKRRISPAVAEQIKNLQLTGIAFQKEYKRFYPEGEIAAHLVGLTNVDDHGQEGIELAYDHWLSGQPGVKEVIKDRLGYVVANVGLLEKPQQGHDLPLSIDHRIQYLAYDALKEAMNRYKAESASLVVLNAKTGEILAAVNQPSFNPNLPPTQHDERFRNRALTDAFEPGSVIKPFCIAEALESGKFTPNSKINTFPGWMIVGGYKIEDHDHGPHGILNLAQVLQKSSNIGAAKIILSLEPQNYWALLQKFGFGLRTNTGFPGENNGSLAPHPVWYPSEIATLAYGYGIAVTAVQLAQAYGVFANRGVKIPLTFLKVDKVPKGERVLDQKTSDEVLAMLESVVSEGGGGQAKIYGYRVAGKTGTAYVVEQNGYNRHQYSSSFVGIAPVSNPQLVVVVVIHKPQGFHYGAEVAAPVFAQVMSNSLRLLNIPPDNREVVANKDSN